MKLLIQLSHPAHFYLYRNVIKTLKYKGHKLYVFIKTKDILENLLKEDNINFINITYKEHRKTNLGIIRDLLIRETKILFFTIRNRIDILTGCTPEVAHVGWLLSKPRINLEEDDAHIIPKFFRIAGFAIDAYLSPISCDNGKYEHKSVKYPSFHELAYLHPNHFTPNKLIVEKYFTTNRPYFILRFAKLNAHHDDGVQGINTEVAQRLVDILKPHGNIYITSERELEPQFEQYRIKINPLDMHHVMAFASLYIGDSQTMAAEAAVLGTPFVRFNDFVGRIGYLNELENDYLLGYGIKASENGSVEHLCNAVSELVNLTPQERTKRYQTRRLKMLSEKIDYAKFLIWFIENYPESKKLTMNADMKFWKMFR